MTPTPATAPKKRRPKGLGSVVPRRDSDGKKYFLGRWFDAQGERASKRVPEEFGRTRKRAEEWTARRAELAKGLIREPLEEEVPSEDTVAAWFVTYFKAREKKFETVAESRGRVKNWIAEIIGHKRPKDVTTGDIEAIVRKLDAAVIADEITWKTGLNIWGEVTGAFDEMCHSKDPALRVLTANPAKGVRGPDRGINRSKPFLRPSEVKALLEHELVPFSRRVVYAVDIYTALRQSELRAITPADVDFETMQIQVSKQAKGSKVKQRTKTGRARYVQIEPNLLPLLKWLVKNPMGEHGRLVRMPPAEDCAELLRKDLATAGCTREELTADDDQRAPMQFHNLRNTCGVHMSIRRDAPFDIQWRMGHTNAAMTEKYISEARQTGGSNFGTPLAPLPACILDKVIDKDPGRGNGGLGGASSGQSEKETTESSDIQLGATQTAFSIPIGVAEIHYKDPGSYEKSKNQDPYAFTLSAEVQAVLLSLRRALDAAVAAGDMTAVREVAAAIVAMSGANPVGS